MTESHLSFAQHAVWFTEQAGVAGGAYRMALALDFGPGLDEAVLAYACEAVLERHPVLRAAVWSADGVPRLVPSAAKATPGAGFDLERGPLARLTIRGRRLELEAHHLVFDGQSKEIFVRDLAKAYNAVIAGRAPDLGTPHPLATKQEEVTALLEGARALWRDSAPEPEVILPGLRHRQPTFHNGHSHMVRVPEGLAGRLGTAAEHLGVTRFELLLCALHLLLARYGNETLPVSVSLSTRTEATCDAIGLFVNDLPLAVAPLDGTVTEYAAGVRQRLRQLYPFRAVPYTHAAGTPKRPAPALTGISVSYRRQPSTPDFTGVEVTVDWSPPTGAARNLLHLLAVDTTDALRLILAHDPATIDAEFVTRIGEHLVTVLRQVLADPAQPAAAIPILSAAERDLTVRQWNATTQPFPAATVPELFAAQARAHPDAVAIVDGAHRLTYAQLDSASARVAAALGGRGAGPGTRVAVCLARSWQAVVAALGVLRAGAAYVPVDPAYPALRRDYILGDAKPVHTMTEIEYADGPVPAAPGPGDPAYVIYTSGSTGRPKGVVVNHAPLTNLLFAMGGVLGDRPDARWLGLTSLSFDISVLELFLPLTTGARLVIAPDALDGAAVTELIAAEGVTHAQATPSGWRILLDAGHPLPPGLVALAGGEALPPPLAQQMLGQVAKLFNGYGPTENTIYSTVDDVGPGEVTIGRPVANTQAYVLDAAGHPAAIGLIGELHLGGAGLAEGYLGQLSLTGQRFIEHPALGRLYRTGDRCSWLPDGRLRYHGRADDQIKIRGHRVEPGEIVARLLEHSNVDEAAVVLRQSTEDDARLVGYLVPRGAPPAPADLRAHLAKTLPTAMVPTHWVVLDRMPRSPNGKLDRAALPDPPAAAPSDVDTAVAESDELTAALAEIWRDVLGVPHIGPDDDLFDLGGHSLTITRISSRISQRFGVHVPLDTFFDTPTIAEIAVHMRASMAGAR